MRATVVEWVTVPEVPVSVRVAVTGPPPPPHPAKANITSIAPARPSRVRNRRAAKIIASSARPLAKSTIWRFDGGRCCAGTDGNMPIEETVTCELIGLVPSGVTEVGISMHVVLTGAPVQVSATAWLNPLTGVTVTLNILLEPRGTLNEGGAVTVKSVPVPLSGTV